jgi:hypothetical protein
VAKGTCFTRLVGPNVINDCHTRLVFLELGVSKFNLQQESQHEYLNSHKLKTLALLLFTDGRKTNSNGRKMNTQQPKTFKK